MEYVMVPSDEYCDAHKLGINDRLQLFLPCATRSYAHRNLIVHLDLNRRHPLTADATVKLLDFEHRN